MKKFIFFGWVGVLLGGFSSMVWAQLVAVDDSYGVPVAEPLLVETPGVLDNDSYNGEPAEDGGATAELLAGPLFGTLACEFDVGLELCADGSFSYTPGVDFPGSDTFTYRVTVGDGQAGATVTLSACDGGPMVFVCWKEAEFLAKLSEFGYGVFREGFEDDQAWASARSPLTAPSVVSQGIKWVSNHQAPPVLNEITTGSGAARSGEWGVFDPSHGYATGTEQQCDIDIPPEHCLFKDGFTGIRKPGDSMLYAAGGYFTGAALPKLVMILDGGEPIALGSAPNGFQFYGVIHTLGFESFRIEETDGKIGQARFVLADDFTFGTSISIIFADGFESW